MEENLKEEAKDNNSDIDIMSDVEKSLIEKDEQISISMKTLPQLNLNKTLEKIHENDEDGYSTNRETKDLIDAIPQDPHEIIFTLRQKIDQLEDQVENLRKKNDELRKDNIQNNSKLQKISHIGIRKNFTLGGKENLDSVKMAEIVKEKNDLQEINENMLNMLTEKEIENEELQENFNIYKNEIKLEVQKYIDTIDKLETKIGKLEENEQNKKNFDNNLDEIIKEYNRYKERVEKSLNDHLKKEEELVIELEKKESQLQNIKNDMQNLEIENIQLLSQTEQKEKDYNSEMIDIAIVTKENEKLKNEVINLQEKIKTLESRYQSNLNSKEEEIKMVKQDLEFNAKNLTKIKEEKSKEINLLKAEINRNNRDISTLVKKYEVVKKENDEIKNTLSNVQTKLDKKTKELRDINESAKKLLENKDNVIKEYENKIEEINKDKNQLIEQNHDLLDKMRDMNSSTLGEILCDREGEDDAEDNKNDNYENLLLKAELKTLKEQLENQATDLISLNAMEKEVSRLKLENEVLAKDNKALKEKMNKQKFDTGNDDLMKMIKKHHNNSSAQKVKKRISITIVKDNNNNTNKVSFEKQVGTLKRIQEDETKNMTDEIDKLKEDIALMKVKYLNQELEHETLIAKYKSILKSIVKQCNIKGIKLNLNLNNI